VVLARTSFRLRKPLSFVACVRELSQLAQEQEVDLIHSSMAYAALLGAPAALLAGCRHVWFQHGPVGGWMDWLAAQFPSEKILYNSRFTQGKQLHLHSLRRGSVRRKGAVLHLGTTIPSFSGKVATGPLRVVMLCRAQAWKGPQLFVEAMRRLGENPGIEARIYLAPADGSLEAELRKQVAGLAHIRIEPPVQDAGAALDAADCVVNASITPEPFGLTLIEAMARGLVPIAPRAGGPLEIIEEGRTGLFFAQGSSGELAEKIRSLSIDPKKFMDLSKAAHASAREKFSLERMMADLENLYDEIL
jgi:glycosyltransferase involved in cell wall biosynthesis